MAWPHQSMRNVCDTARIALLAALAFMPLNGMTALERMDDDAMSGVSGAGIALGFEDFRWLTKPTSYYEQMGSNPVGDTTFQRADMRWYGLSITAIADGSAGNTGFHWDQSGTSFGTSCTGTGLACPLGGQIAYFAPFDNPYVLRAYSPFGYHYDGTSLNSNPNSPDKTVYEYVAPTVQPYYNFSFMGEIEAGRTGPNENLQSGTGEFLKSQTLIQGNAAGSIFRMFQHTQPGNETFAIMYHSHLRGDFRFSAGQDSRSASDVVGVPVIFDEEEGLHFKNVDAFIPIGQVFYQALTLDAVPDQDGNFIMEIPRLRNDSIPNGTALNNAIRHFYSFAVDENVFRTYQRDKNGDGTDETYEVGLAGFITARLALLHNSADVTQAGIDAYKAHVQSEYGISINDNAAWRDQYNTTHGYSRWGDWTPCRGIGCPAIHTGNSSHPSRNSFNSTSDGMFFRKCSGCSDFDAFAYTLTGVDVRPGNSQYTCPGGSGCGQFTPRGNAVSSRTDNGRYYTAVDSCTATSGTDYQCGIGGSYNINAGSRFTYVSGKLDPSTTFDVESRAPGAGLPVIRTDVVNIGDSRIEGLQMNYLKFTSYGAGGP